MSSKDTATGMGVGVLLGAVIGMAIGILYAPHSGRITRGLIDERVHEATRRAERILDEAREKAEDIVKEARTKAGR